jgi:hypothetical protein
MPHQTLQYINIATLDVDKTSWKAVMKTGGIKTSMAKTKF